MSFHRTIRTIIRLSAVLAVVALAKGCGDGESPSAPPTPEPARPTTVTVSPATHELTALGATVQLSAEVRDQNARVMAGATVTWTSSASSMATVDASGLVTAAGNGTATITASAGSASGSAVVTVMQSVASVEVSPSVYELTALGQTVQLTAEAFDENGHAVAGAEFSWESSDAAVATVDAGGLVTAVAEGVATITASAGEASGSAVVPVMQPVASVQVSPSAETIGLGSTLQLTAEAFDENGEAVAGVEFSWESSDAAVAAVDAGGLVTGVAEGVGTITASAGSAQGTAEVTVADLDRAALEALYHATDGPNWVNSDNWLTDAPLGEWYGVDTDASGWVVRLDLKGEWDNDQGEYPGNGLAGSIPPGLGNLSALEDLDLRANALTGPIPPELGNLGNLKRMTLGDTRYRPVGDNNLVGPIPAELGNLANLELLSLGNNSLTGAIPPELGNLTKLTYLSLGPNGLTGPIPAALENLANLEFLYLWHNDLAGPLPPWLGNLAKLEILELRGAGRLTGPIPAEFGSLVNLRQLVLAGLPLGGEIPHELGNLSSLRILQLAVTGLTGRIPPELGNLKNLTNLELHANDLTGPIPAEFGNLSNLRTIYAFSNRLAGPLPPELGKLSKLSDLILSDNPLLVGPLPGTFSEMESLSDLIIEGTGLCIPQTTEFQLWLRGVNTVRGDNCPIVQESEREALEAIYSWTNGAGWYSNTNWLSEEPLDNWYGVTADDTDRVTALDLSDNNLAGILPGEAGYLLNLEDLVLSGNSALGGELPYRILQLTSLSTLRLDGTGVCTSAAEVFQDWLDRMADARAMACPDDHGNDASGATSVSVGERAEGELESYLDEDWFRVEIGGRGTLSVSAEGNTVVNGELYDADGALVGYDGSFGSFSIVRRLSAGTYYVKVTGQTEETRGAYTFVSSFELHPPGVHAYLTQAVQSHDFSVPLVAGEDALLRVFVMADDDVTASMPPVHATFYRGGQEVHSVRIDGSSQQVPGTMAEGDLDATANAVVPGSVLVPGTEMVVEADPDGTLDPSLGIGGRIPKEGRMALDIRSIPDFHVTAVPFLWTEKPDLSGFKVAVELTAEHDLFYETRDWLPVAVMEVSVREAVLVDYDPTVNMDRVLGDIALLRVADGASGYYMGVPPWKTSGILGIAHISGKSSVSRLDGHTIAHEFGHNLSLLHTPCGNPAGVDGRYPHSGGTIGAWGYDFRDGTLVDPELFTDLMTYCRTNDWISDYSFAKAAEYRAPTHAARALRVVEQVLVMRGGVAGGRLDIQPAFVLDAPPTLPERAGPYRLAGSDLQGRELFALHFDMQEVADPEEEGDAGFTFAHPRAGRMG